MACSQWPLGYASSFDTLVQAAATMARSAVAAPRASSMASMASSLDIPPPLSSGISPSPMVGNNAFTDFKLLDKSFIEDLCSVQLTQPPAGPLPQASLLSVIVDKLLSLERGLADVTVRDSAPKADSCGPSVPSATDRRDVTGTGVLVRDEVRFSRGSRSPSRERGRSGTFTSRSQRERPGSPRSVGDSKIRNDHPYSRESKRSPSLHGRGAGYGHDRSRYENEDRARLLLSSRSIEGRRRDSSPLARDDRHSRDRARETEEPSGGRDHNRDYSRSPSPRRRSRYDSSRSRGQRKTMLPEKFDGSVPLSLFLAQFESCADYNDWDDRDKAAYLRNSLKGNATHVLNDGRGAVKGFSELVERLRRRFGTDGQTSVYRAQLRNRRRGRDESLQDLYHDIGRLTLLAFPGPASAHRDSMSVDAFLTALDDDGLEMRVRDRTPVDLDQALTHALNAESNSGSKKSSKQEDQGRRRQGDYDRVRGVDAVASPQVDQLCGLFQDYLRHQKGGVQVVSAVPSAPVVLSAPSVPTPSAPPVPVGNTTSAPYGACHICKSTQHWANRCPDSKRNTGSGGAPREANTRGGSLICFNCDKEGHMARQCPERINEDRRRPTDGERRAAGNNPRHGSSRGRRQE